MESHELIKLLSGGNLKLQLYALKEWEQHHRHDPEPLLRALDVNDAEVVYRALELAARFQPAACAAKVIRLTEAPDSRLRRMAVEHLSPAMGRAAQNALQQLLLKERDPFVLASAVTSAARLRLSPDTLKPFLKHAEIRLRANTVRALGALGSADIRPLVEPALKDPSLRVQGEALIALAPLVSAADLEAHVRRRLESTDPMVRAATVIITAQLPLAHRLSLILDRLADPELRVVHCALRALAQLPDPMAAQHLIECYFSTDRPETEKLLQQSLCRLPSIVTLGHFVQIAPAAQVDSKRLSRILSFIEQTSDWEPFLPWLLSALERPDSSLRIKALELVLKHLEFFQTNLDSLLTPSERIGTPAELALAARIRWRHGELEGQRRLQTMLFSTKADERQAAVYELKRENSLLARGALAEARNAGIAEAYTADDAPVTGSGTEKPVLLPGDEPPPSPPAPEKPSAQAGSSRRSKR